MTDTSFQFLSARTPSLTDFLESDKLATPPLLHAPKKHTTCTRNCYVLVHTITNQLANISEDPERTSLDQIFRTFEDAKAESAVYRACTNCDPGCHRLTTLSMLHQRQLNLICNLAKNPGKFLNHDRTHVMIGDFQPPKNVDLMLKRMMLLRVAHDLRTSTTKFSDIVKDFQDKHRSGASKLSEAGKLNIKWLSEIGEYLRNGLDGIESLLEKDTWAESIL